jgi:hypothetical protein
MDNQLLKKLQIKSGFKVKVLNAPENFQVIFGEIPSIVQLSFHDVQEFDSLLIFATNLAALKAALNSEKIDSNTVCWIIYPKAKTKLACDLNLMQNWEELKSFQLTPCASAAINETWTALRIKQENAVIRSGIGNAEISKNNYGDYINVVNKIITLPTDFSTALGRHSTAMDFFQQLSYSNRKEYVLWILTAKQEKTRIERIHKSIEKLLAQKKNPSEK